MGGIGTTRPQVWARGEPASHRIRGLITVRDGTAAPRIVSVRSASAYNDGSLHQLELRRGQRQLTHSVDVPSSAARRTCRAR
ncbi:hypothetical protein V2W30_33000 [Streptomyces sp. Q6]|uniref:Uncharacterized protein n=1 Tax=Streptomyces citrinus TaxID=3118173 RepID=A0ACD5AKH2_9ACTN